MVSGNEAYGRVEVNYEGIWGTICDDYWDRNDANMICQQLGFPAHGKHAHATGAKFGEGSGNIWLDDVNCGGSESNIEWCRHRGWGTHNCRHSDDAGVYCDRGTLFSYNNEMCYFNASYFVIVHIKCFCSHRVMHHLDVTQSIIIHISL